MKEVLFFQSRFPSSRLALETLLGRWEAYACELEVMYGIKSISIFAPFKTIEDSNRYPHLSFVGKSKSMVGKLWSLAFLVKSSEKPFTFICGDNQFSLIVSVIYRWLFPEKVSIQCQFHGDLYTPMGNPGPKGLLRVLSSRFAFRQADSLRIVSEFQESEIRSIAPNLDAKFIASPIPIDYSKIPKERSAEMTYDVAVVGRLHEERGIDKAISIIKEVTTLKGQARVVFVGEGKYLPSIYHELADEIASGAVVLLGALSGENLRDIYASSKILLSAAPQEGYGLALREACLSGMFVVARNSAGAREAGRDFPGSFIFYDSVQEAVRKILHEIDSFSQRNDRTEMVQIQKLRDGKNLRKLLESWVIA